MTPLQRSMSSVCWVSSVGRPLHSLCCDANLEPACMQRWVGSASMENRALPLHAAQHLLPSMVPPPPLPILSVTPEEPPRKSHPSRSLGAGCCSSSLSEVCVGNNGRSIHTKPGMCLNVAGWVPLFSQSMLCVPCFPRETERDRDTESIGGCVNTEGGGGGDSES